MALFFGRGEKMKHSIDERTNCCDVHFIENTDICRKCKEHADVMKSENE